LRKQSMPLAGSAIEIFLILRYFSVHHCHWATSQQPGAPAGARPRAG
jgi:hypothetical protein